MTNELVTAPPPGGSLVRRRLRRCRRVAITNFKGGVGKTVTTVNLASSGLALGYRVLVVDMDPQANATSTLGYDPVATAQMMTIWDVLDDGRRGIAAEAIVPSEWGDGVDLIAGTIDATRFERDPSPTAVAKLRRVLDTPQIADQYDVILFDCPQNFGPLTVSAFVAAEHALIISEAVNTSTQGVVQAMTNIEEAVEAYGLDLSVLGIIMNKVSLREGEPYTTEQIYRVNELRGLVGDLLWTPFLPLRPKFAEITGKRQRIHKMGPRMADVADAFDQYMRLVVVDA